MVIEWLVQRSHVAFIKFIMTVLFCRWWSNTINLQIYPKTKVWDSMVLHHSHAANPPPQQFLCCTLDNLSFSDVVWDAHMAKISNHLSNLSWNLKKCSNQATLVNQSSCELYRSPKNQKCYCYCYCYVIYMYFFTKMIHAQFSHTCIK